MANVMVREEYKVLPPPSQQNQHQTQQHNDSSIGHQQANQRDTTNMLDTSTTGPGAMRHPLSSGFKQTSSTSSGILPTRKSVDFAIGPPPSKRWKPNHSMPWTAKQVVDAISTSISRNERLEAIQKAKDSFNHDVQAVHDDEMATGVDSALVKHLTFLVYHADHMKETRGYGTSDPELESIMTEISITCDAMESLYRASSEVVGSSFQRMGDNLVHVLINLVDEEMGRRVRVIRPNVALATGEATAATTKGDNDPDLSSASSDQLSGTREGAESRPITPPQESFQTVIHKGTPEGDLLLRKSCKILGHFARVGSVTKPLAYHPGLLGTLVHLVTLKPYECVPWEARLSALWTIANLACNSENMQMMVCTPGLVTALVEAASRSLHPSSSLEETMEILRSKSIASRAVLNLSWAPENKIILADHAALIDLLGELAVQQASLFSQSRTVREIVVATRRHSVGALRNLLAAPRRTKIGLCEYKNGHLLDVLTDAALNDPDKEVKDRAFAAIHNLANQDTAEMIAKHPALVLALKDALLSEEEGTTSSTARPQTSTFNSRKETPKSHASATLLVLERSISPGSDSYENLKDLMEAITPVLTSDNSETNLSSTNASTAAV